MEQERAVRPALVALVAALAGVLGYSRGLRQARLNIDDDLSIITAARSPVPQPRWESGEAGPNCPADDPGSDEQSF